MRFSHIVLESVMKNQDLTMLHGEFDSGKFVEILDFHNGH